MGSCENTILVNEPLHEVAAAEQHSCSESMQNLVPEQRDCIANDSNGNCAGELGEDETSGGGRSRDIDFRDGIKREGQVFGFDLKELVGDECSESTVCLEKNLGEIAADGSLSKELMGDMCGDSVVGLENNQGKHVDDSGLDELMGDRCDDSVVCLAENQGESVDGSGSKDLMDDMCRNSAVYSNGHQGENVDGSFAEELMGDRCCGSTVCSNENQSENVDGAASKELIGDKDGDCMICSNENQDENVDGSGSKEMMGDSCGDAVVCLNDNQGENLDGSRPEELMGDGDSIGYSKENQCENVDSPDSKELMGDRIDNHVVFLDENQSNVDKNDSEADLLCLKNRGSSGEDGTTAMDGSLGLSQDEKTTCLTSGTEISTNCEDQMKGDDENVVGLMLKEFMDNQGGCLTENKGIIDHHDSENDASQDGEMPSELKMVTTSPRNCVKKDKQKDDERVSGSIMQGIMENLEEKSEEKNDVVKRIGTDVLNQILPSQKCEVPFELISVTGEHRNKDDTSTCCSSVEVAMEEKREILVEIETKLFNQMPSIQGSNLPSESIAIHGCRSDCPQKNDLEDSNIVRGPALDGKSGASPMIESNMCSQILASCCAEIISNLQRTGDSVSSCDWHNQKDDLSSSDLSLESVTKPVESKSNDDICIELLASKGCPSTLETLLRAELLHTQQNAQSENKNVNGLTGDCVAEVFEVRTDVTASTKVETSSEIIIAKENACNSKRDSFELGANCLCDKSSFLSCQLFDVVENGLSGRLDPPDLLTKNACAAISSSSSIGCYAQRENEGKDVVKADCVSETKHHPTTSSSSQRGSRKSKSSRKTPAKRAARNYRNTKLPHPCENIEFLFKASRRKRSCSSKPARSAIWGLFSNITQFLETCPEPVCNEVQNQEPTKARGGRGSGKQSKNRAGQKSKGSSGLSKTSTSCLRLKIKVGKEVAPNNLNTVVVQVVDPSVSVDSSFSNYGKETNLQFPKLANVVEDKVELGSETQFQSKEDQEKVKTCSDASIMDVKLTNKVVGSAENIEKSAEDAADNYHVSQSDAVVEASGEAIENKYMDPGTSPDSEVINSIPDAQVGLIHQEESPDPVLNTSGALAFPGGVKSSKGCKRGKKDNHRSSAAASIRRKPKSSKNCRGRQKTTGNGFVSSEALTSSTGANSSRENGLGVSEEATKVEINMDAQACCSPDVPDTKNTKNLSSSKYMRNQLSECSKSQGVSKGKSKVSDSVRSRKGNACRRRGDELKSVSKSKVKEKGSDEEIVARGGKHPLTGNHISDDIEDSNTGNSIASADMVNVDLVSDGVMEQHTQPDNAWVHCDDCHKWRRIPVAFVKSIDEACRWICGDNVDKAFADCSIPQEKSNADINAELGISDVEEDGCDGLNYRELEKGFKSKHMTVPTPSHFWRINSNKFLHRSRKTQTIDEIMVCHCKQPPDGKLGCGDECLNRMLNIECVKGTCPCSDLCSNQQFQKRKYAKMKCDRFGKKGFGLRMLEDISAGHFLIEYVGEVLDMQAYEARQKDYASRGQRHFYFMTLNGSEVIDAYVKGNLGRFINHSCDPNCRTEKWMVNGEICIGLFALRDIKKGEEVTFDYNYVRVFGAAAKKCHCGSPHCRGYIGGDPLSAEVIVHDDSDEESPEPKMLENGETWNGSDISRSSSFDGVAMQSVESVMTGVIKLENMPEAEDSVNRSASATSKLNSSVETEDLKGNFQLAIQPEEVSPMTVPCEAVQLDGTTEQKAMNKTSSSIQKLDVSLNMSDNKLPSYIVDAKKKSKFDTAEDKQVPPKSRPLMKTYCSSGSIKKGKISSNSLNGNKVQIISNKSQVHSVKPKKFSENSSTCRFEAVDEKLNELLDSEGGITKRKDASKGYLKLLLLTATSGDSGNGEAIQSNRELSMILDALLKTKSRLVLTDIINKNGLQMLHNIMKKYRRDFKKIPILRKLLKVLEYLAMREILTLEHINGGPPCAGRESFRESILSLTEHDDKQVHQIARNFRDRWIPKPFRQLCYRDKDGGRMEFHRGLDCNRVSASHNHWRDQAIRPTEAISCIMQSVVATSVDTSAREGCSSSSTVVCQTNGTKIRKRKSRWDQPAEAEKIDSQSPKKLEYSPLPVLVQSIPDHIDKMSTGDKECRDFVCKGEAINVDNGRNNFPEDVPPGFSSPPNASLVPSTATNFPQPKFCQFKCADVIMAYPQKRFISRLPVSYGIPLPILQQFGLPHGESVESWVIAPGMPFHPFPPLPPCPRDKKDNPPACAAYSIGINEDAEEVQQDSRQPSTSYPDENIPSTAGGHPPDTDIPGTNIQQTFKRMRESSYDLGKKYFRQQKRKGPPWHKSECMGNNHIGGTCCMDVANVKNELRNSNYSDDITCRVGEGCNDFYQQPQHPNQH